MAESGNAPLIQLEEGASAPVLRYDIPEPTSYEGKNFIELDFEDNVYTAAALDMPSAGETDKLKDLPTDVIKDQLLKNLRSGVSLRPELPNLPGGGITSPVVTAPVTRPSLGGAASPPQGAVEAPRIEELTVDDAKIDSLVDQLKEGRTLVVGTTLHGEPTIRTVPTPPQPDPHLYLVETIRLTSFLGDYGAGRIVRTFTLLPGEVTRISVKTFRQRESTRKQASSVLDSFTEESASDLEKSLQTEQSDQRSYEKTFSYYADAEASASWGWGSAKVKAGVKGSSNSAREEAVKNISNATEKHTSKASAKREVEINTSFEVTEKEGEERSIEREIENINLSRTLNFVFRQMNQEFVSFLHLTDVRIGFFNGDGGSRQEVPLSALDDLLGVFIKPEHQDDVRQTVLDQVEAVRDLNGVPVNVVDTVTMGPGDEYHRFDRDLEAQFQDQQGRSYTVPGVLLAANTHVMRTEGVMVESLLGNGPALDSYAEQLQQLEVDRRAAAVALDVAHSTQATLVSKVIEDGDAARADIAERLVCRCCHPKESSTEEAPEPSAEPLEPSGPTPV